MLDKLFINKSDNIVLIQSGGHIGHCSSQVFVSIRFSYKIRKKDSENFYNEIHLLNKIKKDCW